MQHFHECSCRSLQGESCQHLHEDGSRPRSTELHTQGLQGEVTALASFAKIESGNILDISLGSSEGAVYANGDGRFTGWVNEFCYVKLDMNPTVPTDPWSKSQHTVLSHMYLGQRGATKLAPKVGIKLPENLQNPHADMCAFKHETMRRC